MNRRYCCFVSFVCALTLVLSGCKGNPFASRDSLLKSRVFGQKSNPNDETSESRDPSSRTDRAIAHTNLDEEAESDRTQQLRDQAADDQSQIVKELMQRAEDALATQDQKKAAEIYQEVVRIQPTQKAALHRLAILFDMNGNFTLAENYFRRALEFAPDDPTLLNDIGYSYLRQQQLEASEHFLQASMNIDPNNQITLRNIGILSALQGQPEAAQQFFQRGGLSPEEAHQEFAAFLASISTPDAMQHAASIDELSKAQTASTGPGHFAAPDLESTYGLKAEPSKREPERNSFDSRNQQNVASQSEFSSGRTDGSSEDTSRFSSETSSGLNYSSYDLERAALNAGPGSLFPIAALSQSNSHQPQLRRPFAGLQDWNTVQPAGFGVPASSDNLLLPRSDSNPTHGQDSPFIHTPPSRSSDSSLYTPDSTGFPVTQQNPNDQSRVTPSYYQFPGTATEPPNAESSEYDYTATPFPAGLGYR